MAERSIVIDGRIMFRPQCRGIGRAIIGFVEEFPEGGADIKMLVPRHGEVPFDLTGAEKRAELVETDLPVTALGRVGRLAGLLRSLDAGVLYCPYHPFVPLRSPCPVVTTVHDCIIEEDPDYAGGHLRQLAYRKLTRSALRRSAAVTVPSQATAHALARTYRAAPGAEVVANGVSLGPPGPGQATVAETRRDLSLPDRYLLHVGARRPHKNQARLVEALRHLDPSVSLVLVGDRDPRVDDPVDQTVARHGLGDRVVALEKVPDRYLPGLYAGAAAFVFPSIQEGYGIPPLEAMACGTPVVASAIPVMAEILGSAALLVSPFDTRGWAEAIGRVLEDRDGITERLTEAGKVTAAGASWERGGRRLHELLDGWAA